MKSASKEASRLGFALALTSLVATGCNAPSSDSLSSTGSSEGLSALACLSVSASVVGLSDTSVAFSGNGSIGGSVVLLGSSDLQVSGNALITGNVYARSAQSVVAHGHASAGTLVLQDLTNHEPALLDFIQQLDSLTPTQQLDQISSSMQLSGNGGLNVIEVKNGIALAAQSKLTLQGGANDQFVILVRNGGLSIQGQAGIAVSGELSSRRVLFLISGNGSLSIAGNGSVAGTFLAPSGSAQVAGNGHLEGALVAYGSVHIVGNGVSFTPAAWCPQIDLPNPAPSSSPSATPSPDPSVSPSPTSTPSPDPSVSPSSSPSPTSTPSPDPSASPSSSPSPDPSVSPSPSSSPGCTGNSCGILGV